jgi:hypothetical protein
VAGIPSNIAIQRLSYAVGTMNKMLLPVFMPHSAVNDVDEGHRIVGMEGNKSDKRSLALAPHVPHADINLHSRAGIKASYFDGYGSTDAAGGQSISVGGARGGSKKRSRTDHRVDDSNAEGSIERHREAPVGGQIEGHTEGSIDDSHHVRCLEAWMDFMGSASSLLAAQVTETSVCDSFLQLKPNNREHSKASTVLASSSSGGGSVCDDLSAHTTRSRRHSASSGVDVHEGDVVEYMRRTSSYNDAAVLLISGVLTEREAERAEEQLQAVRIARENRIEGLLRDYYSYDDRGGLGTADDKVRGSLSVTYMVTSPLCVCV